ncbi:zinc-binding dehydrogenase [Nostoc sphaeroides]|nr:zinc-binding dehydrogenase [Nostoc sphaeroides]
MKQRSSKSFRLDFLLNNLRLLTIIYERIGLWARGIVSDRSIKEITGKVRSLMDNQTNENIHAALYQSLLKGSLRLIVDQEIPLAEAARAHHAIEQPGSLGKICLIP